MIYNEDRIKYKLEEYFYEESIRADKRFQQVHELYQEIINMIPEKGKLFTGIKPFTEKVQELFNKDRENMKDDDYEPIEEEIQKFGIPEELEKLINMLYVNDYVDKSFSKALYMRIKKSELDSLKKDLTLILIPSEIKSDKVNAAGAYIDSIKTVFIFVPHFHTAHTKRQIKELVRYMNTSVSIYHEFTHFFQSTELSKRIADKIVDMFFDSFGIDIKRRYEKRNIEIEAYTVNAIVNYIRDMDLEGEDFIKESYKKSIAFRIVRSDPGLYKIYKQMNRYNKRKVINNLNRIVKYLRNNRKIIDEIIDNYDDTKFPSKFVDRLMKAFDQMENN